MGDGLTCVSGHGQKSLAIGKQVDPKRFLLENFIPLLQERGIVDAKGNEINKRLKELVQMARVDAKDDQEKGESFAQAVIRNALKRLNYDPCEKTLGGLPTGPAYERPMPDQVDPQNVGHEKVGYAMSDYPKLSFLPVGGFGAPMCEVDYATCYTVAGQMIQDKAIRTMTVSLDGQNYDLSETNGTYYALYPYSERSYELPIPFSVLQYSPVIPGDYKSTGLPVEMVQINAKNTTDKPITLTFTINQENILGWYPKKAEEFASDPHGTLLWNKQSEGNISEKVENNGVVGVVFKKQGDEKAQKDFVRAGSGVAGQIAMFSQNVPGKVTIVPITDDAKNTGGLTITITLQPGEEINQPISVAYDNPFYNFQYDPTNPASPGARMPKFYTREYGETGQNAGKIAQDALIKQKEWKEKIQAFQEKITENNNLPDYFKQVLLNELYVLAETGIWEADQARFAYLESIDYKMYNTSDVNSYTWALLILFPELEKKDLLELAKQVPLEDPRRRWFGTDRWANIPPKEWKHLYWAAIKDKGAVCHDLGGLLGEGVFPFTNGCNEFNWSNANMWIDLAPKFALRSYRYFTFMKQQTGKKDVEFVKSVYPSVKMALDTLEKRWGDKATHVPLSKGVPDTTYDTIAGHGYMPNVVTQWLGALEAGIAMAEMVGDKETAEKYKAWLEAGKPTLEKLWNSKGYYNAFVSPDGVKIDDTVHSDMLFGDFYVRMCGLEPVVPNDRAARSLQTIYHVNGEEWSKAGDHGPLGLVNLRKPDGSSHKTEQGDEGWTGAMLLNAAYQIKVGMETGDQALVDNGWQIVYGFYNVEYSNSPDGQNWFGRTPEGYANPDDPIYNDPTGKKYREGKTLPDGTVVPATGRAPKYMRALAIWAVLASVLGNDMPFPIYENTIPDKKDTFPNPNNEE